jgi:hypothetical protein
LIFSGLFAGNSHSDFCKWVDEEGTTHFAEDCPEASDGERVQVSEPSANGEDTELAEAVTEEETIREMLCTNAQYSLDVLRRDVQVYFDEFGNLQYEWSYFSMNYDGPRRVLDDEQRTSQTLHWTALAEENCD